MEDYYLLQQRYLNLSSKSESQLMQFPRKKFVKLLDQLCSTIVILRDRHCVICGSVNHLSNGHYVRRGVEALRWNLLNCNCQCIACNSMHEVNERPYKEWMIDNYGEEILEEFRMMRINHSRWNRLDLIDIYNELVSIGDRYESVQGGRDSY